MESEEIDLEKLRDERDKTCRKTNGEMCRDTLELWFRYKQITDPLAHLSLGCYMLYDPKYDVRMKYLTERF